MKNSLIIDNEKLIYFVIKKMGLFNHIDDYYDVGLIGLVKAANVFDCNRKVSFSTLAVTYIRNEIYSEYRRLHINNKYKANLDPIYLDAPSSDDEKIRVLDTIIDENFNIDAHVIKREKSKLLHEAIRILLIPRDQLIINYYYFLDIPQEKIAKSMGLSQANVSRIIRKCVKKLGKFFNEKRVYGQQFLMKFKVKMINFSPTFIINF